MAQQPHSGQPWSSSSLGSSTTVFHKSLFKIHAARRGEQQTRLHPTTTPTTTDSVLIRDPPRSILPPGFSADQDSENLPPILTLTRFAAKSDMAEIYITSFDESPFLEEYNHFHPTNVNPSVYTMTRKRRSLSNLLIHPFLKTSEDHQAPTSPLLYDLTSSSSLGDSGHDILYPQVLDAQALVSPPASRGSSPPPDFLLDDDPFANYTAPTVPSPTSPKSSPSLEPVDTNNKETSPKPRSPLSPTHPENRPPVLPSPPRAAPPTVTRTHSGRVQPAYQRPAFAPRPSLPSLDALAQMNVVLPKKPRKGRVGAKLPFEPWDNISSDDGSLSACSSQESVVLPESTPELSVDAVGLGGDLDFVADLEADFAESFGDEYDGPHAGYFSSASGPSSEVPLLSRSASTSSGSGDEDEEHETSEIMYLSDSDSPLEEIEEEEMFQIADSSSSSSCVMPPLTRTTSASSSTDSSHELDWSRSSSGHDHETDESDILASPPQPFLSAPPLSRFPSVATTQLSWSPTELYDSLKDATSTKEFLSLSKDEDTCELGTSATTIRPASVLTAKLLNTEELTPPEEEEAMDAGGYERYPGYGNGSQGFGGYGHGDSGSGRRGYGQSQSQRAGNGTSGRGGVGGNGGGDGGRDPRRPPVSAFTTQSDSESEEEESESDDDVPLAQSIPGALTAQKSLRQQVKGEHKRRKREKALEAAASPRSPPRPIQGMSRPPGAGEPSHGGISSSQEAASYAVRSSKSLRRPSTADSVSSRHVNPDDLARRLHSMPVDDSAIGYQAPVGYTRQRAGSLGHALRQQPPSAYRSPSPPMNLPTESSRNMLRPMRSFHRPEKKAPAVEEFGMAPMPVAAQGLGRSLTRAPSGSRRSEEQTRQPRKSMEETRRTQRQPETRSARSSSEAERAPRPSLQRPPMPPLPSAELISTSPPQHSQNTAPSQAIAPPISKGVQQRVFIGDMQRFNMVEITPATTAGAVIEMVEAQGSLEGWVGTGGWMVWEIAHDFGMERPVRSYELLADVQASWNQDKMMNSFVIRISPLAVPLGRSAMPSASPTHSGYVEWESKRGKWNKRWLQLREHSLWLSKRDNGRDEVMLCSLSNFDAYFITRPYKSPKNFTFAVKSTDNLSYFENTNDYLHIFSCSEKDGNAWMEKILVARSYVLHQEKNVLFNPKGAAGAASTLVAGNAGGLNRSGTRKGPQAARPAQPLVSVAPLETAVHYPPHSDNAFKLGSLLRKT